MGISVALAALRPDPAAYPEALLSDAIEGALHGDPGIVALGPHAPGLDRVLHLVLDAPGADALSGQTTGTPLDVDLGYGPPRLVPPDTVRTMGDALATRPPDLLPRPDPDGWGPDPRLDDDPVLRQVARALELYGPAPDDPAAMTELRGLVDAVIAHYRHAAEAGAAMLVFRH